MTKDAKKEIEECWETGQEGHSQDKGKGASRLRAAEEEEEEEEEEAADGGEDLDHDDGENEEEEDDGLDDRVRTR